MSDEVVQFFNIEDMMDENDKILVAMQKDSTFTDVTLVCDDGVTIPCHRVILAAKSSVFKNILSEAMQEGDANTARIPGYSSQTVKQMVSFIYGDITALGSFPDTTAGVVELHTAALKHDLGGLVLFCEHCMKGRMKTDCKKAPVFYLQGFVMDRCCLQTAAIECIVENFDEVEKTDSWKELAKNHPQAVYNVLAFVCKKE